MLLRFNRCFPLHSFEFHWGKHHRAYVDNLNKQIAGTEWEKKTLEEIVVGSWANGTPTPAFNNAAQIWNHTFFWYGKGWRWCNLLKAITRLALFCPTPPLPPDPVRPLPPAPSGRA